MDIKTNLIKNFAPPTHLTQIQRNTLEKPVPDSLIGLLEGQSYVPHTVMTDILNKVFDYGWSWEIISWNIENERETPRTKEGQKLFSYVWVLGQLTVPMKKDTDSDEIVWIKKQAFGAKPIIGPVKTQAQAFKAAASDALKKAASLLGIAQNVYMKTETYNQLLLEEANCEDNWTKETAQLYSPQLKLVKEYSVRIGQEEFDKVVKKFCDDTMIYTTYGKITPYNIVQFISYLLETNQISNTAA